MNDSTEAGGGGLGAARLAWLDRAVTPALDLLLQTGEFSPTLYLHGSGGTRAFTLTARDMEALRQEATDCMRRAGSDADGYVLVYPSEIRFGERPYQVLIVETAGSEDDEAEEWARRYWRAEGKIAETFDRLGRIDNLLDRA